MPQKQRSPETIIHKLREAEILISQGKTVKKASKQIGLLQTKALRRHGAQPGAVVRNGYRVRKTFPNWTER